MKKLFITTLIVTTLSAFNAHASQLSFNDVQWRALNPKRGDASPRAGVLWGDIKKDVATGFLVKFKDGFSSPPHIHNVTYRGVVISGLVHNDDPDAAHMWMPAGSFWTQPAGEVHITAAKGEENIAYIEIDSGPYHVHDVQEAFDNGERPINVDASNITWLSGKDVHWLSETKSPVEVAVLWGKREAGTLHGSLLKLPAGFKGQIHSEANEFRAVLVSGNVQSLPAGSYLDLGTKKVSDITADEESILYIRINDFYKVTQ